MCRTCSHCGRLVIHWCSLRLQFADNGFRDEQKNVKARYARGEGA